jgi:histo-blood group ABO system transferase
MDTRNIQIGIFLICTGRYIEFLDPLRRDIAKYFLNGYEKTIYVFTDFKGELDCCVQIHQEHMPWPFPTLMRYNIIADYCDKHSVKKDYYYYFDVDMRVVDYVGEEVFGKIVGTRHPGFFHEPRFKHIFNQEFLFNTYTPQRYIQKYYAGGFNGGSDYLKMARIIREWVTGDRKWGFIPEHHDEAYLNKYLSLNIPDVELTPSYCYPETKQEISDYGLKKLRPKIVCLFKDSKYFRK